MSEETKQELEVELEAKVQDTTAEETTNFIEAEAHNKVKSDMMKYKAEKRELAAQLERLKEEAQMQKNQELESKQEWEKLAKLRENELNSIKSQRQKDQELMVNSHKKAAVIQAVGGFLKPQYADFAINLDNIGMVDGQIDQGTLDTEVERIKREEGALLKRSNSANIPNAAPANVEIGAKDYASMSENEKQIYKRKLLMDRN